MGSDGCRVEAGSLWQVFDLLSAWGRRTGLDEVAEDSEDLRGIGDEGEDPHLGTTAAAA